MILDNTIELIGSFTNLFSLIGIIRSKHPSIA